MEAPSKSMGKAHGSSSSPGPTSNELADFIVAVRPFHRLVYLVAFAYTKDPLIAEEIAVKAMSSAFGLWSQRQTADEVKLCLIRTTIAEAARDLKQPDIENCREEIDELLVSQAITASRPVHTLGNHSLRGTLMGAIQELSARTAVTLLLRDAFHFTILQIAGIQGETQQNVRARLGYGRIALCVKLARCVSDCDLAGEASLAATY
jgi:DNA-directed RNA polymerase specialized sigma24 family protein